MHAYRYVVHAALSTEHCKLGDIGAEQSCGTATWLYDGHGQCTGELRLSYIATFATVTQLHLWCNTAGDWGTDKPSLVRSSQASGGEKASKAAERPGGAAGAGSREQGAASIDKGGGADKPSGAKSGQASSADKASSSRERVALPGSPFMVSVSAGVRVRARVRVSCMLSPCLQGRQRPLDYLLTYVRSYVRTYLRTYLLTYLGAPTAARSFVDGYVNETTAGKDKSASSTSTTQAQADDVASHVVAGDVLSTPYARARMRACTRTHMHMHMHMHMHTHTHTRMLVCACRCSRSCRSCSTPSATTRPSRSPTDRQVHVRTRTRAQSLSLPNGPAGTCAHPRTHACAPMHTCIQLFDPIGSHASRLLLHGPAGADANLLTD